MTTSLSAVRKMATCCEFVFFLVLFMGACEVALSSWLALSVLLLAWSSTFQGEDWELNSSVG